LFPILVPAWLSILSCVWTAITASDNAIGAISRTLAKKEKTQQLKKESKGLGTLLKSRGFMINLGITIVLTCIFGWLVMSVKTD
jgi:hypothetical protein